MAFNHEYPYVDSQMFNDDWLINKVKELINEFNNFVNLNTIKYADPLAWDITRQYEKNTVVVDNRTGNAYISRQPVPAGVSIDNTEYWTEIYNYQKIIETLRKQIANVDEGNSTTATQAFSVGELVFINEKLYRVIAPMIAGDSFVVDSNIKKVSIEDIIGNLTSLNTEEQDDLVSAINEVLGRIGNLSQLNTEDKQNLVHALNETLGRIGNLSNLNTEDKQNLVLALNEVLGRIGNLSQLNTEDKQNAVHAINEVLGRIGNITNLKTTAKNNTVYAINELYDRLSLLDNRKFIFIGDSYNDAQYMNWAATLISLLGLEANENAFVSSQGGTGFTWIDSVTTGNGFLALLEALDNTISDKDSITDIIVLGGANDILATGNTANINTAIVDFLEYAQENYPNAKVGIGFIGRFKGADGTRTYANYIDAMYRYRQAAEAKGNGYYIEVSDTASHGQASYMLDHVHPNSTAGVLLARCIASYIVGKTASFMYNLGFSNNSGFEGSFTIINNNVHLIVTGVPAVANGVTVNGYGKHGTMTEIGTQEFLYFNKPVFLRCQVSNGGTFYVGWIKLLYDKILFGIENNSIGPTTASSLQIFVSGEALTIDFDSLVIA